MAPVVDRGIFVVFFKETPVAELCSAAGVFSFTQQRFLAGKEKTLSKISRFTAPVGKAQVKKLGSLGRFDSKNDFLSRIYPFPNICGSFTATWTTEREHLRYHIRRAQKNALVIVTGGGNGIFYG